MLNDTDDEVKRELHQIALRRLVENTCLIQLEEYGDKLIVMKKKSNLKFKNEDLTLKM